MHPTVVDLVALVIGSLFVAAGVASATAAFAARPRANWSAVWFGAFCFLYGLRILARAALVRVVSGWPPIVFDHVDAGVTHAILVPATLFIESLAGPRPLLRRTWQLLSVAAIGAIATELITRRPFAAIRINPPLVVLTFAVWGWSLATRRTREPWSNELRAVTAAGVILALTAVYETIHGGIFGRVDAEPFAMLLFVTAMGWFVVARGRDQALRYAALSHELELARSIQQSLLPQRMPDVPGLRLSSAYMPMSAVAGDFYEVLALEDGRTIVVVADVSGHGVPAALIASMVKVAVAAEVDRHDRPGDILTGINRALTGKFDRAYITACCVVANSKESRLTYATAGHPPPMLRRANGRIESLDQGGIVLTMMPAVEYHTLEVGFEPRDRLLIYTDGLTEAARAGTDEFFGDTHLARVVSSTPVTDDLLPAVLQAHRRWIGEGTPVTDDISIVVIEHVGE